VCYLKFTTIRRLVLTASLAFLTACSGNGSLEGWFAPNPNLKNQGETPAAVNSPSPDNLPLEIPRYPGARQVEIDPASTPNRGRTRWLSADASNVIASFYQQQFANNNWEVVPPPSPEAASGETSITARRQGLEVSISFLPAAQVGGETEFFILYQNSNSPSSPEPSPTATGEIPQTSGTFSDIDSIPEPVRRYVQDLAKLEVLKTTGTSGFNADKPITRREYARWLVAANNAIYASVAGKQIRLGSQTGQPAFNDVPASDADFAAIQGLAEAGLIPSRLSGDSTALQFRPNAPLTREELLLWKVPLDNRKALPAASLDSIKQTWGFQDAAKINPKALRAIYADYQNGEQANIRRVFGYTTLLQPQKPVTRGEAAAALSYFGFQGEGISAGDALQPQPTPSPEQ
jgi:hypothetical protein